MEKSQKQNKKNRATIDTSDTHIHELSPSWLSPDSSIKSDRNRPISDMVR